MSLYVKVRICGWTLFVVGIVIFFVGGGLAERTPLSLAGIGVTLLGMLITSIANFVRGYDQYKRLNETPEERRKRLS